jgi:general secretion pathway protein M
VTGPGGIRGKLLALGLLAALLLAGWGVIVEPLYERFATHDDSIARSATLLESYQRLIAATPTLRAQLAELDTRQAGSGDIIAAASDTLAAASLQQRLQASFDRHGAVARSVQALPAVAAGELMAITVRAQFTAEGDALARILYELETGRPVLFVDSLDIRRKQSRRRRRNVDAGEAEAEVAGPLDVRIDLIGYMRGDTEGAGT